MRKPDFLKAVSTAGEVDIDGSRLRAPAGAVANILGENLGIFLPDDEDIKFGVQTSELQGDAEGWKGELDWYLVLRDDVLRLRAGITRDKVKAVSTLTIKHELYPIKSITKVEMIVQDQERAGVRFAQGIDTILTFDDGSSWKIETGFAQPGIIRRYASALMQQRRTGRTKALLKGAAEGAP